MMVRSGDSARGIFVLVAGIALSVGCAGASDPTAPEEVTAELSENITTVINVSWTTSQPAIGYVQYGPTEEMEFNTPLESEPSEEHSMALLGLKPETEYYYRVVTWDGDDGAASEIATISTGEIPSSIPRREIEGEPHDKYTVLPIVQPDWAAISILDPAGDLVWYHLSDREARGLESFRARLSVDGTSVIYNAANISGELSSDSEFVRVALDGSGEIETIPVPLLAHDFVEHEDGTLAAIVGEYQDVDGESVMGNQIVEVDPKDGEIEVVWSTWDCFDPVEEPGDDPENGWTFANALDYHPDGEYYLVGMRSLSSIAKVDRATGECEWVLGSFGRTIDFASGTAPFLHQHQFQLVPGDPHDHIVVFDNEGQFDPRFSRVIEYELDLEANVATQVWSFQTDPGVFTYVLGEAIRVAGGDTFIAWGASGLLERVTEEGDSTWRVTLPSGSIFAFATLADTLYSPDADMP